ncbi:cobalamin biosynthesis protein P47K [Deltaproteobacteria bacterium Smac51]|nr:cobalamin biosynthesis protein P47K [Deltaproteobacteria bacterium Smac51]
MKIFIFTGFLGSGKTTALLDMAKWLSREADPSSIVVIENEIGEANVDGKLMAESGYAVRDLTSGCICCTLSGQLVAALEEIRAELKPRWLLIEATGIAHQTIADVIRQSIVGLSPFSLVLADAGRWDELMENLPMLISTQIENADFVFINKADLLTEDELNRIELEIGEINENAPCLRISAARGGSDEMWRKVVDYAHTGTNAPFSG